MDMINGVLCDIRSRKINFTEQFAEFHGNRFPHLSSHWVIQIGCAFNSGFAVTKHASRVVVMCLSNHCEHSAHDIGDDKFLRLGADQQIAGRTYFIDKVANGT